jgi:hypothetical protein
MYIHNLDCLLVLLIILLSILNQPSLDTSTNTSIWASLSHGVPQINGRNSASAHGERPATGNSIQTSNYDSDDYLE